MGTKGYKTKLKLGDFVVIISGKHKGQKGKLLAIYPTGFAKVEGAAMRIRHRKGNPRAGEQGQRVSEEGLVHISNLMLLDPESGQPSRVGFRITENNGKLRFFKRSGQLVSALKG